MRKLNARPRRPRPGSHRERLARRFGSDQAARAHVIRLLVEGIPLAEIKLRLGMTNLNSFVQLVKAWRLEYQPARLVYDKDTDRWYYPKPPGEDD